MAIRAWTGSGVVGPIDVMSPQESPRQGQGDESWSQQTGRAGLGLAWVGWCRGWAWEVAGWARPKASLRRWAGPEASLRHVRFFQTREPCLDGLLVGLGCAASLRNVRQASRRSCFSGPKDYFFREFCHSQCICGNALRVYLGFHIHSSWRRVCRKMVTMSSQPRVDQPALRGQSLKPELAHSPKAQRSASTAYINCSAGAALRSYIPRGKNWLAFLHQPLS